MRRPSSTNASEARVDSRGGLKVRYRAAARWAMFFVLTMVTVTLLDHLLFTFKPVLAGYDVGRWRFAQWQLCKERYRRRGDDHVPPLLFLGDSSVTYGIRPSMIDPRAFNMSRQALRTCELEELDDKLQVVLGGQPRAIYVGFLWFAFVDLEREGDYLAPRPAVRQLVQDFYTRPQLAQGLLPGIRLARFAAEAQLEDWRGDPKAFFRMLEDGSVEALDEVARGWEVEAPGQLAETPPGWFTTDRMVHFRSFIERWKRRNVPVHMILMPMHPGFRKTYLERLGPDHERWKASLKGLMEGRVIDLEDVLQEPAYYSDAMHLNRTGAIRFTELLRTRIQALYGSVHGSWAYGAGNGIVEAAPSQTTADERIPPPTEAP